MRLWSLHPKYLDPQGLVALWREALLARAVLRGETRGYLRHPQLERFRAHAHPRLAINSYLASVYAEAVVRGYAFDESKLGPARDAQPIIVSSDQVVFEWQHLLRKLASRSPESFAQWDGVASPACHPLFRRRAGPVASWERRQRGA
ncbi:MAG TPA: pyrimidine dimer DNA glycosylase/endonuclease V [Burkholderiales bacterium]|nr:pyrimidine dimer DNA glycosylase/endonuclease V [Burkholderiales bacterium]